MQKRSIRIAFFVMAIVMIISALAGCRPKNVKKTVSTVTSDPFGRVEGNADLFKEVKFDLNGRNILVMSEGNPTDDPTPTMEKTPLQYTSMMETQERFNCTFTFKNQEVISLYGDLTQNHLAGTATFDAMTMRGYNILPGYINSNALLPISDHYDFVNDPTWTDSYVADLGWWLGKKYAIPTGIATQGYAYWYNKDLLTKNNLLDPWTYVASNTWDFEAFRSMCKKVTKQNGDASSEFGYVSESPFSSMIVANGGKLVDIVNGKPTVVYDSEASKEAIQFVVELMNVDKVIPTAAQVTDSGASGGVFGMLPTGKVLFFPYTAAYGGSAIGRGMDPKKIGWVYPPKGPKATDYYIQSLTHPMMYVIPADVSEPEKLVAAVQDFVGYWNKNKKSVAPIDQGLDQFINAPSSLELFGANASDPNLLKLYKEVGRKTVYSMELNYGISPLFRAACASILDNSQTISTALEANKQLIQDKVDQVVANE